EIKRKTRFYNSRFKCHGVIVFHCVAKPTYLAKTAARGNRSHVRSWRNASGRQPLKSNGQTFGPCRAPGTRIWFLLAYLKDHSGFACGTFYPLHHSTTNQRRQAPKDSSSFYPQPTKP